MPPHKSPTQGRHKDQITISKSQPIRQQIYSVKNKEHIWKHIMINDNDGVVHDGAGEEDDGDDDDHCATWWSGQVLK